LGVQTIAKLIAECRDLRAFTDAGQWVAFTGLNPRQRESGKTVVKQTIISRVGSASLRGCALYACRVCAATQSDYPEFCRSIAATRCARCFAFYPCLVKLFVYAWNRRLLYHRRFPVHVRDFLYP
jgi:hypothetical protein